MRQQSKLLSKQPENDGSKKLEETKKKIRDREEAIK
jgi:hypothetical protein